MSDEKFEEFVTRGTSAELLKKLDSICDAFDTLLLLIARRGDEQSKVLANIAQHSLIQVVRLKKWWVDERSDALAWLSRNLFELDTATRFVLQSDTNLKRYVVERVRDERDILERHLKLAMDDLAEGVQSLTDRIAYLNSKVASFGLQIQPILSTQKMTALVGVSDEYESFYKFYSKYAHPSSYLVNAAGDANDGMTRTIIVLKAQQYALSILHLIDKALTLEVF
jgi:hypothetical protein